MKVKIIKCTGAMWYKNKIDEVVTIRPVEYNSGWYSIYDVFKTYEYGRMYFLKKDCINITELREQKLKHILQ